MSKEINYVNAILGEGTIVEDDVKVGFRYHPSCGKTVIGPHSILRAGKIIYGDVKTGAFFQSGHYSVIRARVEMGDYCTVTNGRQSDGKGKRRMTVDSSYE